MPRIAWQKIYPFGASKNSEFCDKNYVIKIRWWNLNFYHMEKKYWPYVQNLFSILTLGQQKNSEFCGKNYILKMLRRNLNPYHMETKILTIGWQFILNFNPKYQYKPKLNYKTLTKFPFLIRFVTILKNIK